eukprot:6241740-Alexandrium_andersonii.AAC.1
MSASLVGSEMCIRDRPQSPAVGGRGPSAPKARNSIIPGPNCGNRHPRDCLLYTSDAADDM